MDIAFKDHLEKLLLKDTRLVDDQGELKGNVVKKFANELDETIIGYLLEDEKTRNHFFLKVKDVYVFKTNDFIFFLEQNKLDNSFTKYANTIGLTLNGKFLKDNTDIVLDFPYKDCILEGGQSTEEGLDSYYEFDTELSADDKKKGYEPNQYNEKQAKRKEIFFNNIIARDEIDRLLEPKAFVNIKSFSSIESVKPKKFTRNKENIITDNLIIKGNNLLTLSSLVLQFKGRVRFIYIDPPYNTGSDSFIYNDNFNHSSWLTFMLNRLELASKLLMSDGVIVVQCSFHQFAYLKVLMCGLFKNHLCDFNIQVRHPDRALTGDKEYNDIIEYSLVFSNDLSRKMPFIEVAKDVNEYTLDIEFNKNATPEFIDCGDKKVEVYHPSMYKVVKKPANKSLYKKITVRGSIREKNSSGRFFVKHLEPLKYPSETLFKVPDMGDDAENWRYFYSAPEGNKNGGYFQGMPTSSDITKKKYPNFFNFEKEYNNVSDQGGVEFRNGKKPEELLKFFIEIFTNKNDIVLDYHTGSGTTPAVAMKMGRQFIGCEQMDNQIDLSIKRLCNVINGDKTGVSGATGWQGGGSFIYLELAKNNGKAKELIEQCKSFDALVKLFDTLYSKYFLHYNIRIKDFKETIIKEDQFKALSLNKQKEMFCRMLDNNQLYVNRDEMEDKQFGISKEDIALTTDFYQIKD